MDLRKIFLATATVLGCGFILVNIAVVILLGYFLSQFAISSLTQVAAMIGTVLFLLASIMMIILGVLIIVGGLYSYRWGPPEGIISLGILAGSFYLLCLGLGSALLQISLGAVLLILSAVFFMLGNAAYTSHSLDFKLIGSIMGIAGGIFSAIVVLTQQVFRTVFVGWNVPFPGPFMSLNILEGIVMIVGPVAVFTNLILTARNEKSASYIFFPTVTLMYGIGMFIGPLLLAFNLWDKLWKAPWLPPLNGVPSWVFNATVFWSVSLIILAIGGVFLVISSGLEFASIVRESSVTGVSPTLSYGIIRRQLYEERSASREQFNNRDHENHRF